MFLKAARLAVTKTHIAGETVRDICVKAKSSNWKAKIKLVQSIITNTLLYSSSFRGLRYLDMVESSYIQ